MTIGIISDTHRFFDNKIIEFLKDTDEIWHAGDIGSLETADAIAAFKPLTAVYGNIDDTRVRAAYPKIALFEREGMKVLMTHIGGYPGHYNADIRPMIEREKPDIVVCGHSHILKVIYDKKYRHLHINPGAAGTYGFHQVRTAIRMQLRERQISDLEIGEWKR